MNAIWDMFNVLLPSEILEKEQVAKVASHALARARALNDVLIIKAPTSGTGWQTVPIQMMAHHFVPNLHVPSMSDRPPTVNDLRVCVSVAMKQRLDDALGQALLHMPRGGNIRP